ncbi:MAG TPA: PPK2 family polyphosphate kinase [Acidimicrobiales bacterium]|nr:PPK2 family polyphosphate kinase [Acidimicrobiales bacterium]
MPERSEGHLRHWLVQPGHAAGITQRRPDDLSGVPGDRPATEAATAGQIAELAGLQDRLWGEARRSLLVVLQGIDAAGKDGTIKHVFRGVNPQGVRVSSFKVPTPVEQSHDFLWRVHQVTPKAGEIGIFNRSHYEDVLVVRVHKLVAESVWRGRYDDIVAFERMLHGGGTTIVKLFLHISYEEQGRRLTERLNDPDKCWKLQRSDFLERSRWRDYQMAYEDALSRTSTDDAPWYVVPAEHKWFRNWVVIEVLLHTLRAMDPRYPKAAPPEDLSDLSDLQPDAHRPGSEEPGR